MFREGEERRMFEQEKRASVQWLAALTAGALLAGPAAAQEARSTIIHGADEEPATLDPAQVEPGAGGEAVIFHVYDRLLTVGAGSADLMPSLAVEVPTRENGLISEDGLTYTFKLREGVTFHDGSPFTADDVKFSWDRAIEMDLPEGRRAACSGQDRLLPRGRRLHLRGDAARGGREFPLLRRPADDRLHREPGGGRGQRRRRRGRAQRIPRRHPGRHRPL
jgi:hypothetical protein